MKSKYLLFAGFLLVLTACSRKTTTVVKKEETKTEAKTEVKPEKPKPVVVKTPTPTSITVNDKVAKRAVDGRLYYDLEGKRYWKNFKDGKYYLYNKSMHENPDFKPPK